MRYGTKFTEPFNPKKRMLVAGPTLMINMSALVGAGKNTFRLGLEYQYWNNKFGHSHKGAAGSGALAKTPMIRTEYHF